MRLKHSIALGILVSLVGVLWLHADSDASSGSLLFRLTGGLWGRGPSMHEIDAEREALRAAALAANPPPSLSVRTALYVWPNGRISPTQSMAYSLGLTSEQASSMEARFTSLWKALKTEELGQARMESSDAEVSVRVAEFVDRAQAMHSEAIRALETLLCERQREKLASMGLSLEAILSNDGVIDGMPFTLRRSRRAEEGSGYSIESSGGEVQRLSSLPARYSHFEKWLSDTDS